MQLASAGFKDALRFGSYLVEARLTIYSQGSPTDYQLPVSAATVTVDRNAAQRRTATVTVELLPTVPPQPLLPVSPSSPAAPFGNEVFIETRVLANPVTAYEWIPLGLFAIATTTVEDSTIDLTVSMSLYDRSWVISQRGLLAPYNLPAAGGNLAAELQALLTHVWGTSPPLTFNITPTSAVVPPASINEGSDPWQAAQSMASAAGYELYFDVNGTVVGRPIPDPTGQPTVWAFTEFGGTGVSTPGPQGSGESLGSSNYTLPAATTVTFTRDRVFNDFIVSGTGSQNSPGAASGSTAPVRGEAKDTNPSSPTYVSGPFGDQPSFVSSSLVTTSGDAQSMAANLLAASLAEAWTITVATPPNPLFDVDDVVSVTRARLGLNGTRMVIDSIQQTIRYDDQMQVTGRAVPG